jgi:hypothetical protein
MCASPVKLGASPAAVFRNRRPIVWQLLLDLLVVVHF